MAGTQMAQRSDVVERCIQACRDCNDVCLQTMTHCLDKGGEHAETQHMKTLRDCSDICGSSVQHMLRESKFSSEFCDMCARICDDCAASCDQFKDDQMMSSCSESCRNCGETCRDMVKGAV
ncbi:MAG: four-helix bundle copper-binding protein [Methanomassiliicoccales archaeon]|nr:four-helix bundle copper-binding protein [Methanomassiliicoccales archaeon]